MFQSLELGIFAKKQNLLNSLEVCHEAVGGGMAPARIVAVVLSLRVDLVAEHLLKRFTNRHLNGSGKRRSLKRNVVVIAREDTS